MRFIAAVAIAALHTGAPVPANHSAASRANPAPSFETQSDQLWMSYRAHAAESFVTAASTPGSAGYRKFLSPDAYTQRFGPSAGQLKAVEGWLKQRGFTQVQASVNDDYVAGIPPASIHGTLTVPAELRADVIAVTGRNGMKLHGGGAATDLPKPDPRTASLTSPTCSNYWGQYTVPISPAFEGITQAATPICGYSETQIRTAYDLTPADTGAGSTIALIQIGGPPNMYASLHRLGQRQRPPGHQPQPLPRRAGRRWGLRLPVLRSR